MNVVRRQCVAWRLRDLGAATQDLLTYLFLLNVNLTFTFLGDRFLVKRFVLCYLTVVCPVLSVPSVCNVGVDKQLDGSRCYLVSR